MPVKKLEATRKTVNGDLLWELCHDGVCGTTEKDYPVIVLGPGQGAYVIQVKITNPPAEGLKFANNDPLWAKRDAPPTGAGLDPQIPGGSVSGKGSPNLSFQVLNSKPDPAAPEPYVLKYKLNFESNPSGPVPPIDPIIINGGSYTAPQPPSGGGGFIGTGSSAFWLLLGAVFLASILGTLIGQMIKSRG